MTHRSWIQGASCRVATDESRGVDHPAGRRGTAPSVRTLRVATALVALAQLARAAPWAVVRRQPHQYLPEGVLRLIETRRRSPSRSQSRVEGASHATKSQAKPKAARRAKVEGQV